MTHSRIPRTRSTESTPRQLAAATLGAGLLTAAFGLAHAETSGQAIDEQQTGAWHAQTTVVLTRLPAGQGLKPWALRSDYSSAPRIGSGHLDLLLTGARAETDNGALQQLDSTPDSGALRLGFASAMPGQRLQMRGQLRASRHQNLLGSQFLPGNRYQVFSDVGLSFRLRHNLAVGAEYRRGPANHQAAGPFGLQTRDGAWKDVYIAWSPTRRISLTAAYMDLGSIQRSPGLGRQTGSYLAAELQY